jgi:hypothetical protein
LEPLFALYGAEKVPPLTEGEETETWSEGEVEQRSRTTGGNTQFDTVDTVDADGNQIEPTVDRRLNDARRVEVEGDTDLAAGPVEIDRYGRTTAVDDLDGIVADGDTERRRDPHAKEAALRLRRGLRHQRRPHCRQRDGNRQQAYGQTIHNGLPRFVCEFFSSKYSTTCREMHGRTTDFCKSGAVLTRPSSEGFGCDGKSGRAEYCAAVDADSRGPYPVPERR